jgi:hypothetical protein
MIEATATGVPPSVYRHFAPIARIGDRQNFNASGDDVRPTLGDIGPTAL